MEGGPGNAQEPGIPQRGKGEHIARLHGHAAGNDPRAGGKDGGGGDVVRVYRHTSGEGNELSAHA
ncbi:hypothetical protein SDC9_170743 [bioreactor metagenome]|uniref:Uncharacterized protein n=1 Tax=bioreactor metagenome TaxID=1076179 RepID=A0A645G9N1_9ZZZZ